MPANVSQHYFSAIELLAQFKSRSLSPFEFMRDTVVRAESLNPLLNAICTPTYEKALEEAKLAEKRIMRGGDLPPLIGIPTTVKDLALTKGVKTMAGSIVFKDRVPSIDHLHVSRMRDAGMISIGKTTTSEFGWSGVSRSPLTGVTHNPWGHGLNAGASSAGAAVCAAAGIGPIHQGSDGAGSIRMPAAFCGVFGMKPSHGRVPYFPMPINGLISHVGPISRTVSDAALMLQAISGPDDRDMTSLSDPAPNFLDNLDVDLSEVKIGFSRNLGYLKLDSEVEKVFESAVSVFSGLCGAVEEVHLDWGDPAAIQHCLFSVTAAMMYGGYVDSNRDQMDPGLVALIEHAKQYTAEDYARAQGERHAYYERVRLYFENYDYLVTPTLSVSAFPVEKLMPEHWEQHPWDWFSWAGFCYPFNLTWLPAATCPCGFSENGLPIGLQIISKKNADLAVLQLAYKFECALPWKNKTPIP